MKSTQHGLRQGLTGKMFFFYQLYITMAASLLVNQTFAIPFNFFPCASAIDANADRLPRGYVIILANVQKQRGIIFHASYSRSGSRGNFQKLQYQSTGESFSEAVPLPLDAL